MPRHPDNARRSDRAKGARAADSIDYGVLQDWIGFNLRMAQEASFQTFARLSRETGMRPGRFATLSLIGKNPGISQTALGRANGRDKSTLSPLLADLVRRGLVARARTRNDKRAYRLRLTGAGEKVLRQLTACARRHEQNLDRIVGRHGRAPFLRMLRKIVAEIG